MTIENISPENGSPVTPEMIPAALTEARIRFDDGAIQEFTVDGATTYTEQGRASQGTWYVEGQSFCSFWPPSYTGCYDLTWLVESGGITGLQFVDQQNQRRFIGRYQR